MNEQCADCGTVNEFTVSNQEMIVPMIDLAEIKVMVPVITCNVCGAMWTDYRAEEIIDAEIAHRRRIL